MRHARKGALATAGVRCLLEALDGEGGHEVLHAEHLVGELLVHQRAVGEGREEAVRVLLAQADEVVLAHHGLAAGKEVDVGAQVLALRDDGVKLLEGEVLVVGVGVVCRPAAVAVQVAAGGGVHEDGPGAVAALGVVNLALARAANGHGVHEEVVHEGLDDVLVHVVDDVVDQAAPVVGGIFHVALDHVEEPELGVVDGVAGTGKLVDERLDLGQVAIEVVVEHVDTLVDCDADGLGLDGRNRGHEPLLLLRITALVGPSAPSPTHGGRCTVGIESIIPKPARMIPFFEICSNQARRR